MGRVSGRMVLLHVADRMFALDRDGEAFCRQSSYSHHLPLGIQTKRSCHPGLHHIDYQIHLRAKRNLGASIQKQPSNADVVADALKSARFSF